MMPKTTGCQKTEKNGCKRLLKGRFGPTGFPAQESFFGENTKKPASVSVNQIFF